MGGFKCKIDYLESLAVTRFSKKLIAPTYLEIMTQQLSPILQNLRHQMEILYQDRLHSLILFGSQARGDANIDSDIDVLIVLKDDIDSWTEIKRTGGIISQICLDNSILVSSLFVSIKQFITQDTALFRNIKKEGKYI